jgi:thiosulfate/3-mercaptopyruvate sulfurtransferase
VRAAGRIAWLTALVAAVLAPAAPAGAEPWPRLVRAEWLSARLAEPDLRVVDMSSEPAEYRKGHVPGAVHLDVEDARVRVAAGGYRVPTEAEAARLVSALGIGPETRVVVYDDQGGLNAAWLFFTLDVFDHSRVALLDGGIHAWRRAGLPLSRDVPVLPATSYQPRRSAARVAGADWLRERLGRGDLVPVDARSPEEFAGRDVRARRGGHIPDAVSVDWRLQLEPDLTFRSPAALRALYASRGVTPDKTVVTYCQTHHRAAVNYFVLRLLGYDKVAGYDRSWSEWGNRADLPVAR